VRAVDDAVITVVSTLFRKTTDADRAFSEWTGCTADMYHFRTCTQHL